MMGGIQYATYRELCEYQIGFNRRMMQGRCVPGHEQDAVTAERQMNVWLERLRIAEQDGSADLEAVGVERSILQSVGR